MNIAILTTDSIPMVGGVSDYLHNLCIELSKSFPISVHSTVPGTSEFDKHLPYPMYRIPESRQLGRRFGDGFSILRKFNTLIWYLKRPYEAHSLLKKIRKIHKADIILIPRWEERSHFWCHACYSMKIPYYLFAYGMELTEVRSLQWRKKRQQDFQNAKQVISISKATSEMLLSLRVNKNQIFLLPPGIRTEKFEKLHPSPFNETLSKIGLSEHCYILTLCRLVKRKGVDLAIRAFAGIANEFPNISFVIAGDGPEFSTLQSLTNTLKVDNRIRFMGKVDDMTKRALFQGCEFFIMPNSPLSGDMEGFGIVFLEAAMFGKAVIGGNNGGVPDAVIHEKTGLLVDTSDSPEPLITAMRQLLKNTELSKKLGAAASERTVKEFSWEQMGSKFIEFLINEQRRNC